MTRKWQWVVLGSLTGVYLVGLGVLAGIISERVRFDQLRDAVLARLESPTRRVHADMMAREHGAGGGAQPSAAPDAGSPVWLRYVETVDAALAEGDLKTAARAWREANAAALRTRTWRPLVEVGDAVMRIAKLDGYRTPYVVQARQAYMAAFTRARAEGSVDGVLKVAEAFRSLGDRELVEQCLTVAETLGAARPGSSADTVRDRARQLRNVGAIERSDL